MVLFNSRLHLFPRKFKSKLTDPFNVTQVFPLGALELKKKEGKRFKVKGKWIKIYLGKLEIVNELIEQ